MDACARGECCGSGASAEGRIVLPGTDRHDLPWKFYNHLIGGIPEDVRVLRVCVGAHWTYVEAECGMGTSFSTSGGATRNYTGDLCGLPLRDVAQLSKSWNFLEASIGVAALNAWYAQPSRVDALGAVYDPEGTDEDGCPHKADVFKVLMPDMVGKKVTVIGHFPHIERIAEIAELTVLERNCTATIDTPDPACEYVLPIQDLVFITGVTIINKTAPRLLDLSKNAQTVFVGPSTIPSEFVFSWGVDVIAGSVVADPEKTRTLVEQGAGMMFGDALRMFRIDRRATTGA
jgi:uncharacterized protein